MAAINTGLNLNGSDEDFVIIDSIPASTISPSSSSSKLAQQQQQQQQQLASEMESVVVNNLVQSCRYICSLTNAMCVAADKIVSDYLREERRHTRAALKAATVIPDIDSSSSSSSSSSNSCTSSSKGITSTGPARSRGNSIDIAATAAASASAADGISTACSIYLHTLMLLRDVLKRCTEIKSKHLSSSCEAVINKLSNVKFKTI